MILSFNKRFINLINDGSKIHTIRKDSHDRWKMGRVIHFATGVRTPNYNQFKEGICTSIQEISIEHNSNHVEIFIDGKSHFEVIHHGFDDIIEHTVGMEDFVKNDGFESIQTFLQWFDKSFLGKIIHWTEYQYR